MKVDLSSPGNGAVLSMQHQLSHRHHSSLYVVVVAIDQNYKFIVATNRVSSVKQIISFNQSLYLWILVQLNCSEGSKFHLIFGPNEESVSMSVPLSTLIATPSCSYVASNKQHISSGYVHKIYYYYLLFGRSAFIHFTNIIIT